MNEWCSLFLIRSAANTAFLEFGLSKERVNGEVIIQIHNTNGNWKIAILRTPYKLESTENTQKTIAKMSLSILMAVKNKNKNCPSEIRSYGRHINLKWIKENMLLSSSSVPWHVSY